MLQRFERSHCNPLTQSRPQAGPLHRPRPACLGSSGSAAQGACGHCPGKRLPHLKQSDLTPCRTGPSPLCPQPTKKRKEVKKEMGSSPGNITQTPPFGALGNRQMGEPESTGTSHAIFTKSSKRFVHTKPPPLTAGRELLSVSRGSGSPRG